MIKTNSKIIPSKLIFLFFLIIVIFLLTRFQNLTSIPVFCDEAIYIRWSQIMKNIDSMRFVSVSDGKQPLYMWLIIPLFKIIFDPLIAGRTLSILSGLGTIIALSFIFYFFITKNILKSFTPIFIYTFLPFTFFFDRLALADNLLAMFGAWSFLFSLLVAKYKRLDLSLILGGILGLAWLTKSPAIYFVALSIFSVYFYDIKNLFNKKNFFKLTILNLITLTISLVIYNILRLGPQFSQIALRNKDYIWSFSEILKHPLDPLIPHLKDIVNIYSSFISIPVIFIFAIALIFMIIKKKFTDFHIIIIIALWWFLPTLANASIAKVFTARYILFTIPFLILLISIIFDNLISFTKNKIIYLILFICFIPNLITIYRLSSSPFDFKLPSTEKGYLQDWTSGWGIKPASEYLISQIDENKVFIGTEGYFGTLPDGLQIYTAPFQNIEVEGVGIGIDIVPQKLIDAKKQGKNTYLLINQSRINLDNLKGQIKLVKEYSKPNQDKLLLFQI